MFAYCIYPLLVLGSLAIFHCIYNVQGWHLLLATYIPVLIAALAIILLEHYLPYRSNWKPSISSILQDFLYTVLIQTILPKLLVFTFGVFIVYFFHTQGIFADVWPHHHNIYLQVLYVTILAELGRYWLHRLAHEWRPLGLFHAIHHSPEQLYWFNVSRFHFLDKSLQLLFDTIPFILFGVQPEVFAAYYVFYAVNGFLQHCNINLKYGFLNYVISGAELHRWHHSRKMSESNNNYGNNLIIWDLVFGSYYLPRDREVGELGIKSFPKKIWDQFMWPFRKLKS